MQIYQNFITKKINKNTNKTNWTLLTYEMQLHGSISSTHRNITMFFNVFLVLFFNIVRWKYVYISVHRHVKKNMGVYRAKNMFYMKKEQGEEEKKLYY